MARALVDRRLVARGGGGPVNLEAPPPGTELLAVVGEGEPASDAADAPRPAADPGVATFPVPVARPLLPPPARERDLRDAYYNNLGIQIERREAAAREAQQRAPPPPPATHRAVMDGARLRFARALYYCAQLSAAGVAGGSGALAAAQGRTSSGEHVDRAALEGADVGGGGGGSGGGSGGGGMYGGPFDSGSESSDSDDTLGQPHVVDATALATAPIAVSIIGNVLRCASGRRHVCVYVSVCGCVWVFVCGGSVAVLSRDTGATLRFLQIQAHRAGRHAVHGVCGES